MDFNILIVLVAVFNMIADILCIVMAKSWLLESGVFFLSRFPEYLPLFDLISFSLIVLLHKFYYFTDKKVYLNICKGICIVVTLFNAYYGVIWTISPKYFFKELTRNWNMIINTPEISFMQNKYRCCGYNRIKEIVTDKCIDSKSKSCMKQISQRYMTNIRSSGVYALTTAACASFIFIAFNSIIKKKIAKHMHRGKYIN